jgi:DNA repair protein RadD
VSIPLRPYQLGGVDRVRRFLRGGFARVLLVAPTGAGKTVIAVHMIECSLALGNTILFLAHRRELIVQAWKKLVGCSCPAGFDHVTRRHESCRQDGLPLDQVGILMGKDPRRNPRAPVQVASIDTLRNRTKPPADVIFIDETHRALAATYLRILECYPEASVIGLTATPYRADGRGLGELYEQMAVVASPRELVDAGFLVEPRVFTVPAADLPKLSGVKLKGGDYDAEALSAAVDQIGLVGNIVEHWQRLAEDRRTVVFAVDVDHSKHIVARFNEAGIAAEHLDGTMPTGERDAILARLDQGTTRVVSNCAVLCEGWDQPSVKCVVLARPTKSLGLFLQQVGRILRPFKDLTALILDHSGNVLEHGLPTDDREFSLEPPPKRRKSANGGPSCKTCEGCFAIVASAVRICPACGREFPLKEEDKTEEKAGELVEVRPATNDEKREEFDRLTKVAEERGYKSGWVYHRYREKFGVAPPNGWQPKKERREYSDEEKRAYLDDLKRVRAERGYAIEWVYKRFHAKFGAGVPAAWMLPSVKAAPAESTKVEWAV